MENKLTRERIERHLEYDWYKYFLLVIASILVWSLIFSTSRNVSPNKEFTILFVDGNPSTDVQVQFDLDKGKIFGADSCIEEIQFSMASTDPTTFYTIMSTSALLTDIIIMPIDSFTEFSLSRYFLDFDEIIDEGYFDAETFKHLEDKDAVFYYDDEGSMRRNGIILNNLARDIFFPYRQDDEGNDIIYVLGITAVSLSSSSSGGNRGIFNPPKQDPECAETFAFIKFMFSGTEYINYRCVL